MNAKTKQNQESTDLEAAKKNEVGFPIDFAADAGAGMEGTDATSFAIPFITLLQSNSPAVETVEGAKAGLYINSITNELYSEVEVIPCAFQRQFIRWAPRSSGGGFKGQYSPIDVETGKVEGLSLHGGIYMMEVPEGVKPFDAEGKPLYDHLSDTRNHFVLAKDKNGSWMPALVSMSSTQIKKSKRWMTRIQGIEMRDGSGRAFTPPSFSHVYLLKAEKEENAKGKWWGVDIHLVGPVQDGEVYARAKKFHSDVVAGNVNVTPPSEDQAADNFSDFDKDKDKF